MNNSEVILMCCKNEIFWDNGYLYGYYCNISGNECDYSGFQECCTMYEEDELEEDELID